MFEAPVPHAVGGSSSREGCSDTQTNITSAPLSEEQSCSLSHLCAGLQLQLPVYPHVSLCYSAIAKGLEVSGELYLWPQRAIPPGFYPLSRGWVYHPVPEAPLLGECRGPRHFRKYQVHMGSGPVLGSTLKKALCHTCLVGGTEYKYHQDGIKVD